MSEGRSADKLLTCLQDHVLAQSDCACQACSDHLTVAATLSRQAVVIASCPSWRAMPIESLQYQIREARKAAGRCASEAEHRTNTGFRLAAQYLAESYYAAADLLADRLGRIKAAIPQDGGAIARDASDPLLPTSTEKAKDT